MSSIGRREFLTTTALALTARAVTAGAGGRRLLYVAEPGIRNYVDYGGVGVLVFDVDANYRFVRRIPTWDVAAGPGAREREGHRRKRPHGTSLRHDAAPDRVLRSPDRIVGCGTSSPRAAATASPISPDGRQLFVPSFEGPHWNVLDAATGETTAKIVTNSGAHNTIYAADGRRVYLAGLHSPLLSIADPASNRVVKTIGPFSNSIRPFTVNAAQTRCYVNVNELLGFEVGNLTTGRNAASCRREGRLARAREAARLPEPRDRADAGRARAVGVRRRTIKRCTSSTRRSIRRRRSRRSRSAISRAGSRSASTGGGRIRRRARSST